MASLLRCPTYSLSSPPLVLPDEGRFALSGAPIRQEGEGFGRKAHNFCVKAHCFHAKVHRFFWHLLAYESTTADDWGKVHRAGENAPQAKRRIPRFPQPRWVFFCSSPLFPLRKRGDVFALRLQPAKTTCRHEGKGEGGRKCRRGGAEARAERRGHKGTKKRRQT